MDTAEDACSDPHMYKAVKHSQDCFVRMGQSGGLVRTDARKNVFFRAQNGKGSIFNEISVFDETSVLSDDFE